MTEMSGLFRNKKLNVVDESGSFVRSSTWGRGGGGSTRHIFLRRGSAPRSNSFIPSDTDFYEKGFPFVYLLLTNGTPFTRLSQSPSLLISGSGSWPQREGRVLALSLAFAAENLRKFKSTARASCS